MAKTRKVEVFSAGCPACEEAVSLVKNVACPSCDVSVLDMNQPDVAKRAKGVGVNRVPAVVVDGKLADCCRDGGVSEQAFRRAGIGQPLR